MFNKLVNILAILSFLGLVIFSLLPENDFTLAVAVVCCWVLIGSLLALFFRLVSYITAADEEDDNQSIDAVVNILKRINKR